LQLALRVGMVVRSRTANPLESTRARALADSSGATGSGEERVGRRALAQMVRDGAAVLAAILVAFGLDAWWGNRDQAAETRELLIAIRGEFQDAAANLDSIIVSNGADIAGRWRLAGRTDPTQPPIPADSLEFYLVPSPDGPQVYDPAFGALSTLISVGGLERIHDAQLQRALGGWFGELDDLGVEERQLEAAVGRLWESTAVTLSSPGVLGAVASGGLQALWARQAEDQAYREANVLVALVAADYQADLERLRARMVELAGQLEF